MIDFDKYMSSPDINFTKFCPRSPEEYYQWPNEKQLKSMTPFEQSKLRLKTIEWTTEKTSIWEGINSL